MKILSLLSLLALSGVSSSVYGMNLFKKKSIVPSTVANNLLPGAQSANMDDAIIAGQSIVKTNFFKDLNQDGASIKKFILSGFQVLFPLPTAIDGDAKATAKVNYLKQKIPLILANPYPLAKIALAMLRQFLAQVPTDICGKNRLYDSFFLTAAGDIIGKSGLGAIQKAGHPLPASITSLVKGAQPYQLLGQENAIDYVIKHTSHDPNENLIGLIFQRVGQAIDSFLSQASSSINNQAITNINIGGQLFAVDIKQVQKPGTREKVMVNVSTVNGVGAALLASYFAALAAHQVSDLQSIVNEIDIVEDPKKLKDQLDKEKAAKAKAIESRSDLHKFDISNYLTQTPADKDILTGSNILPIVEFNKDLPVLSEDGHKNAQDSAQWREHYFPYFETRFDARFRKLYAFYLGAMNGWKEDASASVQASVLSGAQSVVTTSSTQASTQASNQAPVDQSQQQVLQQIPVGQSLQNTGAMPNQMPDQTQTASMLANQNVPVENQASQPSTIEVKEEKKVQALETDIRTKEAEKQKLEAEKAALILDKTKNPQDDKKDDKVIANVSNKEVIINAEIAADHQKEKQIKAQEVAHEQGTSGQGTPKLLPPPNLKLPSPQGAKSPSSSPDVKKEKALEADIKKEQGVEKVIDAKEASLTADEAKNPGNAQKDRAKTQNLEVQKKVAETKIAADQAKEAQIEAKKAPSPTVVESQSQEAAIKQELAQQQEQQQQQQPTGTGQADSNLNPVPQQQFLPQQPVLQQQPTGTDLNLNQDQQQQPMQQGQPFQKDQVDALRSPQGPAGSTQESMPTQNSILSQ